ncbi:MAG: LysR family transcriptional regulator [Elusimicrobia bacterium]|nr:LysR family transcriptional regulator [Elusimicrobiota bacterium]
MLVETFRIFRDLVDSGSFSKAAERNFVTQSAVSQQIKNLEETLGCSLVGRAHGELRLTPSGLIFYRAAGKIAADYEELFRRLKPIPAGGLGGVRVSAIYSIGTYVLQDYIRGFIEKHTGARIDVEYQKADRVYDDILKARADLGIMAYPAKRRGVDIRLMQSEEMVLICHPRHPLAGKAPLALADIGGRDFIAFDPTTPTRTALDKILRWHGVKVNVQMELDNIETVKSAVEARRGIAIVPEASVRNEARLGKLQALRFSDVRINRPLCVLVRKGRPFNRAVQLFLEHLRGKAG